MPRKRDPNDLVDHFVGELQQYRAAWETTCQAVNEVGLRKTATTDTFLRASIAFERFQSEWHIAAVHRNSARFRQQLENRIDDKLGTDLASYVDKRVPSHLTLKQVRDLLDPYGRNLALPAAVEGRKGDTWRKQAERVLEQPYLDRVRSYPSPDWRLINAVGRMRNHLAHRSPDSTLQMNVALTTLDGQKDGALRMAGGRRVRPSGVGRYLWARTQDGARRVDVYLSRLEEITEHLRVP